LSNAFRSRTMPPGDRSKGADRPPLVGLGSSARWRVRAFHDVTGRRTSRKPTCEEPGSGVRRWPSSTGRESSSRSCTLTAPAGADVHGIVVRRRWRDRTGCRARVPPRRVHVRAD
jgi:hypothetical protein